VQSVIIKSNGPRDPIPVKTPIPVPLISGSSILAESRVQAFPPSVRRRVLGACESSCDLQNLLFLSLFPSIGPTLQSLWNIFFPTFVLSLNTSNTTSSCLNHSHSPMLHHTTRRAISTSSSTKMCMTLPNSRMSTQVSRASLFPQKLHCTDFCSGGKKSSSP
jgi:hypothetical protein